MLLQCSSLNDSSKNEYQKRESKVYFGVGKEVRDQFAILINSFDQEQINNAANIFIQTGAWYCPTILTNQNYFGRIKNAKEEIKNDTLMQYVSKSAKGIWGFKAAPSTSFFYRRLKYQNEAARIIK